MPPKKVGKKITDRFDRYIQLVFDKVFAGAKRRRRRGVKPPGDVVDAAGPPTQRPLKLRPDAIAHLHDRVAALLHRACREAFAYMHTSKPPRVTLMKMDVMLGLQQILPHTLREFAEGYVEAVLERYAAGTARSKTKRAGLHVSIGRVAVHVRRHVSNHQLRHEVFVILAAFLEYVLVEVFQAVKAYLEAHLKETSDVTADIVAMVWQQDRDLAKLLREAEE